MALSDPGRRSRSGLLGHKRRLDGGASSRLPDARRGMARDYDEKRDQDLMIPENEWELDNQLAYGAWIACN